MKIFIGMVLLLFVLISLVLILLARFAVRPKVHTLEYEKEYLKRHDFMQGESLEIVNEHTVKTYDGHELWVLCLETQQISSMWSCHTVIPVRDMVCTNTQCFGENLE